MTAFDDHGPGDSLLGHQRRRRAGVRSLGVALVLTLGFALVELLAGIFSGSLALISDAGHMATDASGLLIALTAQFVARRPPTPRFSFGYGRVEAIAAFSNGLLLFAMTAWIVVEAIQRFGAPPAIDVWVLIGVGTIGLLVNLLVAWFLSRDSDDLNTRAAFAHVIGDLLGSVAAISAGLAIALGAPLWVDPLLSVLISILILRSAWAVTQGAYWVLMESVPTGVNASEVAERLASLPQVKGVHNLHIWELAQGQVALSAHLRISDLHEWPGTLERALGLLAAMGIDHATLQPEV